MCAAAVTFPVEDGNVMVSPWEGLDIVIVSPSSDFFSTNFSVFAHDFYGSAHLVCKTT